MQCPGHQKEDSLETHSNCAAGMASRQVANLESPVPRKMLSTPYLKRPHYSEAELKWVNLEEMTDKNRYQVMLGDIVFLPESLGHFVIYDLHDKTHLVITAMVELLCW